MGKISLVSAKYIIHARISVDGVVDRPDVIGSVFGQTEGLLGSDLELRELQRSGRIGRIEVDLTTKNGKSEGNIDIPSSLDKTETALIAAAIETIQRIGPCNAKVTIDDLEDVRIVKRSQVITRAKALLSNLTHGTLPDSRDIKDEVSSSVRMADVVSYGRDKLPAGPDIEESDEVILVEGRADVLNLLKHDIKNSIAMNGTSVPQTIIDLSKEKTMIVFVDGDRGGELIIRELSLVAKIDFAARAPDGKEVEEITQKEILQSLRGKIPFEDALKEISNGKAAPRRREAPSRTTRERTPRERTPRTQSRGRPTQDRGRRPMGGSRDRRSSPRDGPGRPMRSTGVRLTAAQKETFKKFLDELTGTKGAYILDKQWNVLGKVPLKELDPTIEGIGSAAYGVVVDGVIKKETLEQASRARITYLIGQDAEVRSVYNSRVKVVTERDL